jgi:hypothetical protein
MSSTPKSASRDVEDCGALSFVDGYDAPVSYVHVGTREGIELSSSKPHVGNRVRPK